MASPIQSLLDILISPERGAQRTTTPSISQTSQPVSGPSTARTQPGQAPVTPTSQSAPPSTFGLNDIGDAMRLITQNPIEFAVPAILGVPLEQVFLGAINRQQKDKQPKDKKKDSKSKAGSTILQDVLEAKDSNFISTLLKAFGLGG